MRMMSRAKKSAIAVTTVLFASVLTVAVPSAVSAAPTPSTARTAVQVDAAAEAFAPGFDGFAPQTLTATRAASTGTGTVTGTISSSVELDAPVVALLAPNAKKGYHRWKQTSYATLADAAGNFTLTDVKPGTYTAVFGDYYQESIAARYYGNTDNVTKAKSFTVKADGTVTGINAKLVPGVTVSGKISTSSGKALTGATALVARKITVDGKPFWEYVPATTGADGRYSVSGVSAGTLAVKAEGPAGKGYASAFYGGGTRFETSKTFTLSSGGSKTVNIKLTKKLKAATPKISGTAKVGKKLTAKPGTWSKGTTLSYRWYANGKKISKATKSTFTITSAQKGKKIVVKVTGKKSGYGTVTKTSKATKKVR
jgi:hypothetical protein